MPVEIKVPSVGESVSEVELGEWQKQEGDVVAVDETLVMLESDKATVELPAPAAGVLTKIVKLQGASALVGETIAYLEVGATAGAEPAAAAQPEAPAQPAAPAQPEPPAQVPAQNAAPAQPAAVGGAAEGASAGEPHENGSLAPAPAPAAQASAPESARVMPAAARVLAQNGLTAADATGTGPGGRVLKEDATRAAAAPAPAAVTAPAAPALAPAPAVARRAPAVPGVAPVAGEGEEVQRMTPLRRKIAERLVEAQQTGALLTTFNEVDMSMAMDLRKQNQDAFTKKYGIKLGFMSFFVKAVIDGLKQYPAVNSEIRGDYVVYKNYFDIGVAIGGGKALVVPVLRHAERMSFAEIEVAIGNYAQRVKDGKITPDELIGGTFTITNGGVYGSLLSTPIVNPPQSAILGMHTIQDRPIALNGQVVIRPMMYIALTYDHRIIDGREAVSFLKRVKECVENPNRMLLEV